MTGRSICPVCDSPRLRTVSLLAEGRVLRCGDCSLEITASALTGGSHAPTSDGHSSSTITAAGYREEMISGYHSHRSQLSQLALNRLKLYSRILGRSPRSILEVGSGTGWMIRAFHELGVQSAGLEIDEALVAIARENGANVHLADICQIDPSTYPKHDVICSSQTLEHIMSPRSAIANMKGLARPGGLVHLDVPNAAGWGAQLRRLRRGRARWGVIDPPHHQIGYYPKSLRILVERAALEIMSIMERPTDDSTYGQAILPSARFSKVAIGLSRWLGHGYLLIGLARVPDRGEA